MSDPSGEDGARWLVSLLLTTTVVADGQPGKPVISTLSGSFLFNAIWTKQPFQWRVVLDKRSALYIVFQKERMER